MWLGEARKCGGRFWRYIAVVVLVLRCCLVFFYKILFLILSCLSIHLWGTVGVSFVAVSSWCLP